MTSVLTSEKERELVEMLGRLQDEIKEREMILEKNTEIQAAIKEMMEVKRSAEGQHEKVGKLADTAQKEHDQMIKLYEDAHEFRKDADKSQEEFIKAKLEADEYVLRNILASASMDFEAKQK